VAPPPSAVKFSKTCVAPPPSAVKFSEDSPRLRGGFFLSDLRR
jgi:hypothetical protein